jgi:hypothetical protein
VSFLPDTIYTNPKVDSPKVLNEKATKILKENNYHSIGSDTRVQVQCEYGNWRKIKITKPKHLNHVSGWIFKDSLLPKEQSGVFRVFDEDDFYWSLSTRWHKKEIVQAINELHTKVPKCRGTISHCFTHKSTDILKI